MYYHPFSNISSDYATPNIDTPPGWQPTVLKENRDFHHCNNENNVYYLVRIYETLALLEIIINQKKIRFFQCLSKACKKMYCNFWFNCF